MMNSPPTMAGALSSPRGSTFVRLGRSSSIYHLDDCACSSVRCAWKQLQKATGPCQLWATCDPSEAVFCLNFVSTCFDAWLRTAQRYEERVLFGVLGCLVDGTLMFFSVVRVGQHVDEATVREVKEQKEKILDQILTNVEGELLLSPDADKQEVIEAIAKHLECDPHQVRV